MSVRVNLLPEARLIKLRNQQTKRILTIICSVIVGGIAVALVVLIVLLGARNIQSSANLKTKQGLDDQLAAKKKVEVSALTFNIALSESERLSNNRILISQLFDRLTAALPKNVRLTDITVDPTYKIKASVSAPDYNTVDLFGDALRTYNTGQDPKRNIAGLDRKVVFTEIRIDSVSTNKSVANNNGKTFDVTFQVDPALVQKFREDIKTEVKNGN